VKSFSHLFSCLRSPLDRFFSFFFSLLDLRPTSFSENAGYSVPPPFCPCSKEKAYFIILPADGPPSPVVPFDFPYALVRVWPGAASFPDRAGYETLYSPFLMARGGPKEILLVSPRIWTRLNKLF